jgi:tetratricopeptide (TPR) repeat protein
LFQALSCYEILEADDWSARLASRLLRPDQVAQVRRTAYEQLLWLANDALRRGDHGSGRNPSSSEAAQQALAYLRKAEAAAPPTAAFYRIRATCRKALGQEEEAGKDLELAGQAPETRALDHLLLGLAAYDAGNMAEAVQQCEAALRAEPAHYWSLLLLGYCQANLGQREQDFVAAATAFTGCILKRPEHAQAYLGRGNAYRKLQRMDEAVADYREATRLRPGYTAAHHNLASALAEQGKHTEAETEFREALRLRPDFPAAHYGLGALLMFQRKHAEAEAEFRQALARRPDFPEARNGLASALAGQGKLAEAEAEYREALRLRPDFPAAHNNLAMALYRQGKHAEAEAEYRQALRLRPDYNDAHNNLAVALNDQGKNAEAEAELREVLRLRPDYPEAHNNLGNVLRDQEKHAEAEGEYRQALRLQPGFPEAHKGLGDALYGLGKHAEAEAEFRQALRLQPNYPEAYNGLGNALSAQVKLAEAEAEYREAVRLAPNYPLAHCNLGLALQRQGRFAEALVAWKRGHELGSRQPNWRHPTADVLRQLEQLVALDAKLPQILRGEAQPGAPAERLALAKLCQEYKKRFAAAAHFYAEAFAGEPKLADDLRAAHRYNAACAAALAGCGQGEDGAPLDDAQRGGLRRQALDWLRADLTAWDQILEKDPDKTRATVQQKLRHWQQDTDFAGVRGDALAKLPEAERTPWQQLWADVEQTLRKASARDTKNSPD